MFAETADKDLFSQHTNIMAVLTNSIDPKFQKDLIEKVLHEKDVVHTSIYFKFYLFRALQKVGMGNEYFSLLDPWKNMLDAGLTTFAETDVNPRSDCHAWSATPCFDMLSLVVKKEFRTSRALKQYPLNQILATWIKLMFKCPIRKEL